MTDLLTHADVRARSAAGVRTCIRDVRAVTPRGVIENATVTMQGGVIVEVAERGTPSPGAIDGRGAFLFPGFVDAHSGGLEKEGTPRPDVQLPLDFALHSFEGRVRAAGITTVFHGVRFEDDSRGAHTVGMADAQCNAIETHQTSGHAIIDHHVLHRVHAGHQRGLHTLLRRLEARRLAGAQAITPDFAEPAPVVSFAGHTSGHTWGDASGPEPGSALAWLTREAAAGEITLMTHDPTGPIDIDDAEEWHASVAEFPTTTAAAVAARECGMTVVCGAPNVLRGGSHIGNVSAQELIAAGLCDVLASDYMPASLLGAVTTLVELRVCDLPRAVELVSAAPAAAIGLRDRGRIAIGMRADVTLVSVCGHLSTVRGVWSAEEIGSQ